MEPITPVVELDRATESFYRELLRDLGEAAQAHRFVVAPNPCVGAAVLSDGVEIGRGFHQVWGGPHAEVHALEAAAKSGVVKERWDTLVITLEPCSSSGKTPPCTEAIVSAGIRRVVVGAVDPDPRQRGQGFRELRERGVEVVYLEKGAPLESLCPHFVRWTDPDRIRRARPWTIAKWAQTRTGQLRPPEDVGEGRWISCADSLAEVQVLRGRVDAIVTGIETCLTDDPRLTVRPPGRLTSPPMRVVLDADLRLPPEARLLCEPGPDEAAGEVVVLCRAGASPVHHRALEEAGARVVFVRHAGQGRLDPRDVGGWLWEAGVRRLLLEAGPTLVSSWFEAELVDQIRVYTGNVNGGEGKDLAHVLRQRRMDQVLHRESGEDAVLEAFYV